MAVTLMDVKEYLRIDGDIEDTLLNHLMSVAEAYLAGAVDGYKVTYTKDTDFAVKADMVFKVIVADLYENRNSGGEDYSKNYSRAVESLIRQLQYYPAED